MVKDIFQQLLILENDRVLLRPIVRKITFYPRKKKIYQQNS